MDNRKIARELLKIAKEIQGGMTEKAINKLVDKVNKYIEKANRDDILAVEPDSTWESEYEFKPVKIKGKYVYIEYEESYPKKKVKDRYIYTKDDDMYIDDMKWALRWVIRAVKKGYKSQGETPPKF